MNAKINRAKREVKRIIKQNPKVVEFAYIYGSALTKKDANDIDILFVVKDENFKDKVLKGVNNEREEVSKKYKDTIIHIQPVQSMSSWWRLILKGEPWIIDSLNNTLILKDSNHILKEISEMVRREFTFKKEETAENLMERSEKYFTENKNYLLDGLSELSEATTEAMQIFLIFKDKVILSKRKIISEIEKNHRDEVNKAALDDYKEIIDLEEKALKGTLTEFSAENIDDSQEKSKAIINHIEKVISKG